jgi:hypothetical protein
MSSRGRRTGSRFHVSEGLVDVGDVDGERRGRRKEMFTATAREGERSCSSVVFGAEGEDREVDGAVDMIGNDTPLRESARII